MRRIHNLTSCATGLVAISLLLGACAGVAPSAPSPSPSPHPAVDPISGIPLPCDELFPISDRAQLLGVSEGLETPHFDDPLLVGESARLTEAGGEYCEWVGPSAGVESVGLGLAVLPDVTAEITDYPHAIAGTDAEALRDAFGTGSVVSCDGYPDSEISNCTVSVLVAENYWVDGYVAVPSSGGIEGITTFLNALDSRLRSTEARADPVFTPPSDALGMGLDCHAIETSSAFKAQPLFAALAPAQPADQSSPPIWRVASNRVSATNCTWPLPSQEGLDIQGGERLDPLTVSVTPGGEWYWPTLAELANGDSLPDPYKPVNILHATDALMRDGGELCNLLVLVDQSVVTIQTRTQTGSHDACAAALEAFDIVRTVAAV